ncbi:MAG: putative integral rane protein [Actinomycetia bacterium]|nr:putative integral rane protein [Actinomycetes bacterium]
MTTTTMDKRVSRAAGAYGLRGVTRMEWRKLRSVRSTWWTLAVFAAGMVGLAILVGLKAPAHPGASFDPTEDGFAGLAVGQLALGTLGVLALSTEFTSGSIRATFAAVPRRGWVLAAKAAVLTAVTLGAGAVLAFASFIAGQAAVPHGDIHATLGQPGVLRAVLMAGAYPALIALIGLGLAALIRHTAGAISAVVGVVFVLPLILLPLGEHSAVMKFLPEIIAENSLTAVKPVADSLSAGAGLAMLCVYAAAALAVGGWALARRDA